MHCFLVLFYRTSCSSAIHSFSWTQPQAASSQASYHSYLGRGVLLQLPLCLCHQSYLGDSAFSFPVVCCCMCLYVCVLPTYCLLTLSLLSLQHLAQELWLLQAAVPLCIGLLPSHAHACTLCYFATPLFPLPHPLPPTRSFSWPSYLSPRRSSFAGATLSLFAIIPQPHLQVCANTLYTSWHVGLLHACSPSSVALSYVPRLMAPRLDAHAHHCVLCCLWPTFHSSLHKTLGTSPSTLPQ